LTTTLVGSENAVVAATEFFAVTRSRILQPASAGVSVYRSPLAAGISEQVPRRAAQRSHPASYVRPEPSQLPRSQTSVCPSTGEPSIAGWRRLTGAPEGAGATGPVGLDAAKARPSRFAAETTTRIKKPTSLRARMYVCSSARPIGWQRIEDWQRCQR
jgi:hypothetical protein